ncbi:rhodanese-like domain-containing protein [Limnothrix sp. FACHB-1083]|uniref:rhodanese-like domain-containing protein n=1 Tax=unclassified Limnothrix TaxID=2632864 RepID=UPI00168039A8|nr:MULTISPECIES: rhodanese-like domain-containing protein [unclassified Limnothrix]MBD2160198.1 rhodanese-like domain-containing protein [Limnothrix sp. FACHB-1083]MBD2190901.1 rhodanese-like domain-containing protein [Limnothrix sp. FACHB-1088]
MSYNSRNLDPFLLSKGENTTEIVIPEVSAEVLYEWLKTQKITLIDVREVQEFQTEHIAGAVLQPLSQLNGTAWSAESETVVLYCRSGRRSAEGGQRLLRDRNLPLVHLKGGILAWKAAGYPTVVKNESDSI